MAVRVFVAGGAGVIGRRLTAIAADRPDRKHIDRWFATTNRLRAEGTDRLSAAAEATGVSNFVAQSYADWNGTSWRQNFKGGLG
ncbi:hypothetical protein ACTMTI_43250 [Nonomuraea sp. H19]|uniref:hypothetical protein n=1 Tax=Nonomuraea sp. H19 TaxID=3452206 RepID=UPI003F8A29F5